MDNLRTISKLSPEKVTAVASALMVDTSSLRNSFNIVAAFKEGIISADDLIPKITGELNSPDDMPLYALILRHVSPDLSIDTTQRGKVHLLVYIDLTLEKKKNLLTTALLLAILSGTDLTAKAYASSEGTVMEWLTKNKMDELASESFLNSLSDSNRLSLSVLLNKPELQPSVVKTRPELRNLLFSQADGLIEKHLGEYKDATLDVIDARHLPSFKVLVSNGAEIDYFTLNTLLLDIRDGTSRERDVLVQMLYHAIRHGIELDKEQVAILSSQKEVVNTVMKIYKEPRRIKLCRGDKPLPSKLVELAISAGIDVTRSKSYICNELDNIVNLEKAGVASELRQRSRIVSNLSQLGKPKVDEVNACKFAHNKPLEYGDLSLAFYEGADGQVWCFTIDSFEGLINSGLNPYTKEKIPRSFISQIEHQLETIRASGAQASNIVSIEEAVKELNTPDVLTNDNSHMISETVFSNLRDHGVDVSKLDGVGSAEAMQDILNKTVKRKVNLSPLSPRHRRFTFSRAVYHNLVQRPSISSLLFRRIKAKTRSVTRKFGL